MLFPAVKNLVQEKTLLLISVGGVAFSVLLIMSIQGLYQGWSNEIGEYDRTDPAVDAITKDRFVENNTNIVRNTFLPIILALLLIGIAVGMTVTGLTIFTSPIEKARSSLPCCSSSP